MFINESHTRSHSMLHLLYMVNPKSFGTEQLPIAPRPCQDLAALTF